MSILNVNQIQPVGSGQTVTISAANLDITGNLKGVTSSGISTFSSGIDITGGQLRIGTTSGDGTLRVFGDSGRVIIGDTSVNYYDADTHIFRNYAAAQKVTINSSGNIVLAGSGQGIDFSANSNAAGMTSELLDDYEEGTYTPVLSGGGYTYTSGSYTAGRYTKVGRIVTVEAHFNISAISGSSNGSSTRITLPFAPSDLYTAGRWCQVLCRLAYFNASAIQRVYCAQLTTNSSSADIVYYYTSSGSGTDQPVNIGADYQSASNNGQIAFTMTYATAS